MEIFRYKRSFKKALLWAALAILFIYRNRASVTYPLFMASTLAILAWDCKSMGKSLIRNIEGKLDIKLFYCIVLMLLSIHKCISSSVDLQFGSGMGILLIFSCLLLKIYSNQEAKEITAMLCKLGQLMIVPLKNIAKPFTDSKAVKQAKAMAAAGVGVDGVKPDSSGKKTARSVLLGLVIAIPLLWIILALLSSADLVFGNIVEDILDCIHLPKLSEDWFGIPFKFFLSFLAFYTWTACLPAEMFFDREEHKKFDAVVAITFNSLIAVVYLLFSGIQFVYLVGQMELPKGYTYAEYAHEGFYQLLAVTILNLILVSFCKKHFAENRILKVILLIISVCTYVMIASSALRMYLYVGVYGLSHLRVYVLWLLVILTVWTTILIIGIFKENIPYFRIITVFVSVWYLVFAFSMPDKWITAYDLSLKNVPTDLVYEVYPDAAPILKEDGRFWREYCFYLHDELDEYREKNILSFAREYNFSEDYAMRLIEKEKLGPDDYDYRYDYNMLFG
ncbi:MAG: DUF4173 domain-containing protein [Lachnospiraceae bacterium]|nr:DUF4173 domain-containing protein [Lachnospiraceae bacterium]